MPSASSVPHELLAEHPWLADELRAPRQVPEGSGSRGSVEPVEETLPPDQGWVEEFEDQALAETAPEGEGAGDPIDVAGALSALDAKREEVRAEPSGEHFEWSTRGGPVDHGEDRGGRRCLQAHAKSALGRAFLEKYFGQQSVTFALARYGGSTAKVACEYWVSKMEHLLAIWRAQDEGDYAFNGRRSAGPPAQEATTKCFRKDESVGT
jgi:hypothetical protein